MIMWRLVSSIWPPTTVNKLKGIIIISFQYLDKYLGLWNLGCYQHPEIGTELMTGCTNTNNGLLWPNLDSIRVLHILLPLSRILQHWIQWQGSYLRFSKNIEMAFVANLLLREWNNEITMSFSCSKARHEF